jgi:aminoglycoside phosphotransferase
LATAIPAKSEAFKLGQAAQLQFPEPELLELIQRKMGAAVASCQMVTTIISPSPRRAFRVELEDGRLIKVRQLVSEARAQRIKKYLLLLNGRHFPKLLANEDKFLFLEWIDGTPLNSLPEPVKIFEEAGRILGWVHSVPAQRAADEETQLDWLDNKMLPNAEMLKAWKLLSSSEASKLHDFLQAHRPQDNSVGLMHGDFCGENLVLGPKGIIYSIDNESLEIGFPQADVSRALMRWGLEKETRAAFLNGYGECGDLDEFLRQERFWNLVSLLKTVKFRYQCRGANYQSALIKLKTRLSESSLQ